MRVDQTGSAESHDLGEMREELKAIVVPAKVYHTRTKFLHVVDQKCCFRSNPKRWVTACGWPFMDSHESQAVYTGEDLDESPLKRCRKCFK